MMFNNKPLKKKAQKPLLVVILGSTGSGKSALALALAEVFKGEIVSADSRTLYKGFDVGTAKPSLAEQQAAPHHLIDVLEGDKHFSAGEFKKLAHKKIFEINEAGRVPFLVGGTMQYVSAMVEDWNIPAVMPQPQLRAQLETWTKEELQQELKKLDPETFKIIDINNPRRLVRALEVVKTTGVSFVKQRTKSAPPYRMLVLGIVRPRVELYERIDKRVDNMVKSGLLDEVSALAERYGFDAPGMSGIGYREFKEYFEAGCNSQDGVTVPPACKKLFEKAIQQIKYDTHEYVRKQQTWFKKMRGVQWIQTHEQAFALVRQFLNS